MYHFKPFELGYPVYIGSSKYTLVAQSLWKYAKLKNCQLIKRWRKSIINMLWWSLGTSVGECYGTHNIVKCIKYSIYCIVNIVYFIVNILNTLTTRETCSGEGEDSEHSPTHFRCYKGDKAKIIYDYFFYRGP